MGQGASCGLSCIIKYHMIHICCSPMIWTVVNKRVTFENKPKKNVGITEAKVGFVQ